jgi:intracellular multiplication protein IcmO
MSDNGVVFRGVDTQKFDDQNLGLGKDQRPLDVKLKSFFANVFPIVMGGIFLAIAIKSDTMMEISAILSLLFVMGWSRKRKAFYNYQNSLMDKPKYFGYEKKALAYDFSPKEGMADSLEIIEKTNPELLKDAGLKGIAKKLGKKGKAIFFFGHEINSGQEAHLTDDKTRTHIVLFGTTGAGKTETILSMCVNFLVMSSSFILVDGKGDQLLFGKVFALCRAFDRLDDLYLLNFLDPGTATKRVERVTNTFNFFVDSNRAEADAIVGGLLPTDEGGGSGMWEGRAASGIQALNHSLYWMSDNGYLQIDPDVYRGYFELEEFARLAMNEDIPKEYRGSMWTLLKSLNYKYPTPEDPNPKQPSTTEEQWQFISMQFTETFNMLAQEYGHITVSQCPEISMTDIVLRRRILLVLLPALSKSTQQVRNLGKIIIAMTRNVSSKALGNSIEGSKQKVIDSKPTNAISSFGFIFDEFGTYASKGSNTLPAQVRSLNIVCLFAGQDYRAFEKDGMEEEAATIFANCTIKICMKLECDVTFEKFDKSAGQSMTLVAESFEAKDTIMGRKYREKKEATIKEKPVLDMRDLKQQGPGMATIIYGSQTERLQMFYADPIMCMQMRINHFVEILPPTRVDVDLLREKIDNIHNSFEEALTGKGDSMSRAALNSNFSNVSELSTFESIKERMESEASSSSVEITPFELILSAVSVHLVNIELVDERVASAIQKLTNEPVHFDDEEIMGQSNLNQPEPEDFFFPPEHADPQSEEYKRRQQAVSNDELFSEMEAILKEKKVRLLELEKASFSSLKEMGMDAFRVEAKLATLEQAIAENYADQDAVVDAERYAKLSAETLVADMGIKSNIASAIPKDAETRNKKRSYNQIRGLINSTLGA